ncbi:MAG TPA: hypothetical protein VK737_06850, partial [Opitutales bacterium]|nr:hypothetical protein [Opitutales bacterium]
MLAWPQDSSALSKSDAESNKRPREPLKVSSKEVILSASLLVACMALLFPRMAGAQSFNYPDFSSASLAATPL